MENILLILFYILSFSIVTSLTNRKAVKIMLFFVFSLLVIIQSISLYTIDQAINYQVYYHLDIETAKTALRTAPVQLAMVTVFTPLALFTLDRQYSKNPRSAKFHTIIITITLIFSSKFLSLYFSPFLLAHDIDQLRIKEQKYTKTYPNDFLSKNYPGIKYTFKEEASISSKNNLRNIIVIYLESFENTYLFDKYYQENEIAKEIFDVINEDEFYINDTFIDTSGFTAGAIFSTQCGLPPWFGSDGNNVLKTIGSTSLTCFNDVLKKADYQSVFMSGDHKNFAGLGDFLQLIGYETIFEDSFSDIYKRSYWGIHDLDLMKRFKTKLSQLSQKSTFNINLATIGPHPRNGIPVIIEGA